MAEPYIGRLGSFRTHTGTKRTPRGCPHPVRLKLRGSHEDNYLNLWRGKFIHQRSSNNTSTLVCQALQRDSRSFFPVPSPCLRPSSRQTGRLGAAPAARARPGLGSCSPVPAPGPKSRSSRFQVSDEITGPVQGRRETPFCEPSAAPAQPPGVGTGCDPEGGTLGVGSSNWRGRKEARMRSNSGSY
jgi:hypothetical protein